MPRKRGHVPGYRLHKPSGQARVIIDGEHIYLGKYGSPKAGRGTHDSLPKSRRQEGRIAAVSRQTAVGMI